MPVLIKYKTKKQNIKTQIQLGINRLKSLINVLIFYFSQCLFHKTFPFYHKLAAVLVSLVAIGYLVVQGKEILSPLIFSCLFSIFFYPWLLFWKTNRISAVDWLQSFPYLLLVALIGAIVYLVGVQ